MVSGTFYNGGRMANASIAVVRFIRFHLWRRENQKMWQMVALCRTKVKARKRRGRQAQASKSERAAKGGAKVSKRE